jgi:hypothetical protein
MDEYLQTRWVELKDDQYYMINEEAQHDGRASYTSGTSFNSRGEYKDLDLHERSLWEEDENEDNMAALDVHQCGGNVNP